MVRFTPFLVVALASVLVAAVGPAALPALAYTRPAVGTGEVWRLLTTHFVHAGVAHLMLNLAGLALVALAAARELSARAWAVAAVVTSLGSSLGVFLLSPRTGAMAGMSGLLHGLLAAGGAAALRRDRRVGVVLLVVLAAKITAEQLELWPAAAPHGRGTATDAHLYGALAGGVAGLLLVRRRAAA